MNEPFPEQQWHRLARTNDINEPFLKVMAYLSLFSYYNDYIARMSSIYVTSFISIY